MTTEPTPFDTNPDSQARLHDALRPLTSLLAAYAEESLDQPRRHGYLPGADARGMAELADEHRWATAEWGQPLHNAHTYGSSLVSLLLDHLAALAAVLEHAQVGPMYAHLAHVRATVDVAPTALWLLDVDLGFDTRIKRSIVYRLESAWSMGRNQHVPKWVTASEQTRHAAVAYAEAHAWTALRKKSSWFVDDQRLPVPSEHFGEAAFGAQSIGFDSVALWNFLSATLHGAFYALAATLVPVAGERSPFPEEGEIRGAAISSDQLTTFALLCFNATSAAVSMRQQLMGWTESDEQRRSRECLEALRRALAEKIGRC